MKSWTAYIQIEVLFYAETETQAMENAKIIAKTLYSAGSVYGDTIDYSVECLEEFVDG